METTHLANFLILAQTSNMTRAAERVNLSQPALSGQLRKLEQELGTSLFHRQGRGLVLTAAGETFRSHAADILARLDAARSDLGMSGSLEGGAIAIGGGATAVSCLLPRVISQFRERHPGVRFSIKESPSRAIAEAVLSGELDLGIVTLPLPVTTAGSQLDTTPWLEDELVLLTPPNHPLAKRQLFHWRELIDQPLITFESGSAVRELLDQRLGEHGVQPAVVMELRAIASIATMVATGIGLGFVSRFTPEAERGLRCADGAVRRQLALIERRDRVRSPALEAFCAALLAERRTWTWSTQSPE